jgi:nickel superoxide dismutase
MRARFLIPMLALLATPLVVPAEAEAHCQIPCGIYDDQLRALLIREHIGTLEKSMNKIDELSAADSPDLNQIVRWVENKEDHADEIVEIVTAYFLSQRVKLPAEGDKEAEEAYQEKLALLHGMLVHTMKARQGTDLAHIEQLRALSQAFETAYFGHPVEVTAH